MRIRLFLCLLTLLLLCACSQKAAEPAASSDPSEPVSESESISETEPEESEPEKTESEDSSTESIPEESSEEESSEPEPEVLQYDLSATPGLRFDELLQTIAVPEDADEQTFGYSYLGSYDELLSEAETLTSQLPEEASACCFPLEGYLLSMNYELTQNELPGLKQMLDQSLAVIQDMMVQSGTSLSLHEVLTRASIVQIEGSLGERGDASKTHPEVMAHIASVIDNRISSGTPLQMDVTRWYAEDLVAQYGFDSSYEDQYNTYLAAALPLGPIASPSIEAVQAVLYPEQSNDLFFVYAEDGTYYFAETYDEHLANCEKAGLW